MFKKVKDFLKQGPWWRMILVNVGLAGLLTLFALFFSHTVLKMYTKHGESIEVPALSGMHIDEVKDELKGRKLKFRVEDSSNFVMNKPPLTVLSQYPEPGQLVKKKRVINVFLNPAKPPLTAVPDLREQSLKMATINLRNHGLEVGKVKYIAHWRRNVLEQKVDGKTLKPGTEIRKGSKVDLVLGSGLGEELTMLPDLAGLTVEQAQVSLGGNDLVVGTINVVGGVQVSDTMLAKVVDQKPNHYEGREVRIGSQVDLYIRE